MTTIAFDGVSLCADTLVTEGDARVGYQRKIHRWKAAGVDHLAAYAGHLTACHLALDWVKKGMKKRQRPVWDYDADFEIILVRDKEVLILDETFHLRPGYTPYTLGSGAAYALAALHLGKSAREAVELACKLDIGSGGEIHEEFL